MGYNSLGVFDGVDLRYNDAAGSISVDALERTNRLLRPGIQGPLDQI